MGWTATAMRRMSSAETSSGGARFRSRAIGERVASGSSGRIGRRLFARAHGAGERALRREYAGGEPFVDPDRERLGRGSSKKWPAVETEARDVTTTSRASTRL